MQDVLCMRYRTEFAVMQTFDINSMKLTVSDLGGQDHHKPQWIRYLQDPPKLILFLAPLSDYNELLMDREEIVKKVYLVIY